MEKIKYLINRIIKLDYKNMFKIAKNIAKKTKKNRILILIDMVICGIKYQAGYYDYQEFEFYNLNSRQRATYLSRGKNNEIIKKFNDKSKFYIFDNKDIMYEKFNEFIKREWLKVEKDNKEKFLEFVRNNKIVILKPSDGECGYGIEKYVYVNDEQTLELYNRIIDTQKKYIVEQCVKQNEKMNKLYDKSVNTLRMFTFYKAGEVFFLQAVLKIGNGGVVDNFSSGGMYTYVDENGYVFVEAIDRNDNIYYEHPITKEKIVGFKIPLFEEAIEMVKKAATVVPEVGYIGWDVAIGEKEPILIEGNCFPGIFQVKPSLSNKKEGLIPKYNSIMNCW